MHPTVLACLLVLAASPARDVEVLGTGAVVAGAGAPAAYPEVWFELFFAPAPALYGGPIDAQVAASLPGQTFVFDRDDGPLFTRLVELLTNGTVDSLCNLTSFPNGAQGGGCRIEPALFDTSGLACPNGIDFQGALVERVELRIDSVFFGPMGATKTRLDLRATLTVLGRDPAPCLPRRLGLLRRPGAPALHAERIEAGTGPPCWRFRVDHAASAPDAAWDLFVVSRRNLDGALPEREALVLAAAPGTPFELPVPPGGSNLALTVRAAAMAPDGRFRLTNAVELGPFR